MSDNVFLNIKNECRNYFIQNPYSIESISSLSRKIGRNENQLNEVISSFKKEQLIISLGNGLEQYYKYNSTKDLQNDNNSPLPTTDNQENTISSYVATLTKRETEVFHCLLKGYSSNQIAQHLYITPHTVKNHITNIFRKLDVSDRAKLIAKYHRMIDKHLVL